MSERPFLPFALPEIGQDEIDEVIDTLRSGWLTTGPKTRRFEQDFAAALGGGVEAMAVNSATAGLHLALEACGIGPGDEVITTTYTFTASAEIVRYLGADPVLVDVDPHTLEMIPSLVERAITPRTKAIIPVHLAGLACDMDSILAIAKRHGLRVVEDAAHAFPVRYKEGMIGTLASDFTVYSFYATKTVTTGEGGMVVTRDPGLAQRCRTMRLHGIDRDAFDRYTSDKPGWYYEIIAPGFKYNMTDLAASLGIHQLKRAQAFKERRTRIADAYLEAFADLPVILPAGPTADRDHAWHLFILRLAEGAALDRNRFIERMSAEGRIGCSVHYIPLHMQPYWKERYGLRVEDFPVATKAFEGAVSLPIYTLMTDRDLDRVISEVRRLLGA
jgi:dTDP-4-amino-4,6-dideoxygalactose transaminase